MAQWWDRTKSAWRTLLYGPNDASAVAMQYAMRTYPDNPRDRYKLLELYYRATVYKELRLCLPNVIRPQDFSKIVSLENPAIQAVDFHVMHLFPGDMEEALPIEIDEDAPNAEELKDATDQVFDWSNFELRKRDYSEWQALYGIVFLKPQLSDDGDRAYIDVRKPEQVTEYRDDSRGFINYARLDIDLGPDPNDTKKEHKWWTEVWDKEKDSYTLWLHTQGPDVRLEDLGEPEEQSTITSFGYDFVPLVKANFAGGVGVFEKYVEAFDELNRQATKLRARYFRYGKPDHVIERNEAGKGAVQTRVREDVDERPTPNRIPETPYETESDNDAFINIPGQATFKHAVPDINYDTGLAQITDTRTAIENNLAELRFFRGHDTGDPSAAAMRQHIAPAISKAREARGNAENALVQAIHMALTIGQVNGLFEETQLGLFEERQGTLSFKEREIVPETPAERSLRLTEQAARFEVYQRLGLLEWALVQEGYTEEEAKEIMAMVAKAKEEAQQRALEQAQATAGPQQNGAQQGAQRGGGRQRIQDILANRGGGGSNNNGNQDGNQQ